jgi:hypothetical protein
VKKSDDRWSEGPPEDSASRWSAQPPLDDDSSSSESASLSSLPSILPDSDVEQPIVVPPRRSPLVWALIVAALIVVALIGAVVLARSVGFWQ